MLPLENISRGTGSERGLPRSAILEGIQRREAEARKRVRGETNVQVHNAVGAVSAKDVAPTKSGVTPDVLATRREIDAMMNDILNQVKSGAFRVPQAPTTRR